MFSPTGARSNRARLTDGDGVGEARLTLSAPHVLVHLRHGSESRRAFRRAAESMGVVAEPVAGDAYESADWTYCRNTGRERKPSEPQPRTFRVVGSADRLEAVIRLPWVESWGHVMAVRVPVASGGNGTLSAGAERRLKDERRERMARAEDVSVARERDVRRERGTDAQGDADRKAADLAESAPMNPDAVQLWVESDRDVNPAVLVAELMRLAERAATLTDAERLRVLSIRRVLGI